MNIYFAADESDKKVQYLMSKSQDWFKSIQVNSYIDKIQKSWESYHGLYYSDSHNIHYGGEQGEIANIAVNHYRNIAQHMLVMVTSTRPAFQARATNTDRRSLVQAKLANSLLDYYMREKRLEKYLKKAVEYAIVLGSGYIKMEWNATKGEIYDYVEPDENSIESFDEEGNALDKNGNKLDPYPIYEGDVEFNVLSPLDVVFDSTKEHPELHDWVLVRTFINKFDLAKKYPEFEDKILNATTKDKNNSGRRTTLSPYDETTDVPVYEFFHKRTESIPEGNYTLYLDSDIILADTIMPYRQLPVYRIAPSDILGTPYGYSMMFDLLPIQDAVNGLYSTILTNQNAFGVQSILNPRGNDVRVNQLQGGLNFIEYNSQVGKPEALNLTATPGEIFNFLQKLENTMETISGVNSVARGNPESSLRSGNALALVQSQALQFISGLQQSYIQLLEDVGTGLVKLLQDFAKVPRIIAIGGINQATKMQEFKSEDINSISRVVVDVGNALMQCLAKGTKILMADGTLKNVEDIKVDDKVMGLNSESRTVEKSGCGFEEMFHVKNKKDEVVYTCNRSHIMTLKYCSSDERYNAQKGQIIDISVKDYLELPERHQRLLMGFKTSVEFDKKEIPLDAYGFGLWLGDGHSDRLTITTSDLVLEEYWKNLATSLGYNFYIYEQSSKVNQVGFAKTENKCHSHILKELEIYKNKHIPYVYKYNNHENLLSLLAGFIDADGTLVDQTFIIEQKSDIISNDIVFIARSLGFKCNIKKIDKVCSFNGVESVHNIITIGGDTWRIPTKLERKQSKIVEKQKDWLNYGIKLESIGSGEYFGFTLKEDPHFLLGDFTVTHNTTAGRAQIAENLLQMGLIKSPEKYLMVLNTGNLDYLMEGEMNELDTIKAENEALLKGEDVISVITDDHALHIKEHKAVIADPVLRRDPDLLQRTIAHIQEHIELLRTVDPGLLAVIQQQPLPPAQPPIPPQQQNVPNGAMGNQELMNNPQAQSVAVADQIQSLPNPPNPSAPFENSPQTPQQAMNNQIG